MNTLTGLRDVFYSGSYAFSGMNEPIAEIAFLIDEGYLAFHAVSIAEKHEYFSCIDDLSARKHAYDEAAGGENAHIALKLMAGKYIERSHNRKVQFEKPFCGYYPDVVSDDGSIVIECGHTQNPDKMLDYFRLGNIHECIQIPYPDPDDDMVRGYSFAVSSPTTCEFLEFLAKDRRSKVKELLSKRDSKYS